MQLRLYYIICILLRLFIAYLAYLTYKNKSRFALVFFFIAASLGFTYFYLTKQRQKGAFGQKIWWDFLRPIHAFLFMLSAILLSLKVKKTYIILLIDVIIGPFTFCYL